MKLVLFIFLSVLLMACLEAKRGCCRRERGRSNRRNYSSSCDSDSDCSSSKYNTSDATCSTSCSTSSRSSSSSDSSSDSSSCSDCSSRDRRRYGQPDYSSDDYHYYPRNRGYYKMQQSEQERRPDEGGRPRWNSAWGVV